MKLEEKIKTLGNEVGFDLVGVTRLVPSQYQAQVEAWVKQGHHGQMDWFGKNLSRRIDSRENLFGHAVSAITVGLLYRPIDIPMELRHDPSRGLIARYAWYDDYHTLITTMLTALANKISIEINNSWQYQLYVDTGPVLEREVGSRGGLGFIGKNTTLINPTLGSYFFLGEIICDLQLKQDKQDKQEGTCGQCQRCQDKCPTNAFVGPFQLDARRCISYLTIEHRGAIPIALRPLMKNWIYGCDVCQEVCPWNKKAKDLMANKIKYQPELVAPPLEELLKINELDFALRFKNSPIKRIGWSRWMRNILIACGNWQHKSLQTKLDYYTKHSDQLVASTAHWARQQIE